MLVLKVQRRQKKKFVTSFFGVFEFSFDFSEPFLRKSKTLPEDSTEVVLIELSVGFVFGGV